MTQYTTNYHLDLYEDSDKPNLRGQYNAAVSEIDALLFGLSNGQVAINNNISTLQTQTKGNEAEIAENSAAVTKISGDVDAMNAKLTTDEANIGSLQAGLSDTQSHVVTLDSDVSGLRNTVGGFDSRIAGAENDAASAQTKAAQAQTGTAAQQAYWQALGVTGIDEAQALNADIRDVHATTVQNQADIARIKQELPVNDFDFPNQKAFNQPSVAGAVEGNVIVLSNAAKTIFKVMGYFLKKGTAQYDVVTVPGTTVQGVLIGNVSDIVTAPDASIVYNATGIQWRFSPTHAEHGWLSPIGLRLDTSGNLYMEPPMTGGYADEFVESMFVQTALSVHNSNTPAIPPYENENA